MQRCSNPGRGHLNRPSARFCEKCGQDWDAGDGRRCAACALRGVIIATEPLAAAAWEPLLRADTCALTGDAW